MPHIVYNPRRLRKSNERLIVPACLGGIIRAVTDSIFERSISLLGDEAFSRISDYRVAIFGVGGVGGWCAEALVRTGVRNITLVDDDIVAESNVNRQRQATPSTIGRMKVEVLRDILLDIAPDAAIASIAERYTPASAARFDNALDSADFVIDAIDSVDCKAHLIQRCANPAVAEGRKMRRPILFSSMGAALRTDPTRVKTSPFNKVTGDGLARALRNRFRKCGQPIPRHICVHSEELPMKSANGVKGSLMPVTCAFGMALASLVIGTQMAGRFHL